MPRREEQRQDMRLRILRAAQEAFLTSGYSLANMDDISDEAGVTKQTIYRYFKSKMELFQATLSHMGKLKKGNFFDHLVHPDPETALRSFAKDFIRWHLSDQHIGIYKLLIAESGNNPGLFQIFSGVGPDNSRIALVRFFKERLGIEYPETTIDIWIAILLAFRNQALMGLPPKTDREIDVHARNATKFLLAAISPFPATKTYQDQSPTDCS